MAGVYCISVVEIVKFIVVRGHNHQNTNASVLPNRFTGTHNKVVSVQR